MNNELKVPYLEETAERIKGIMDSYYDAVRVSVGIVRYHLSDGMGDIRLSRHVLHVRELIGVRKKLFGLRKEEELESLVMLEHTKGRWTASVLSRISKEALALIGREMKRFSETVGGDTYIVVQTNEIPYEGC